MQLHFNKADGAITIVAVVEKSESPTVRWVVQFNSRFYEYKDAQWEESETETQYNLTLTLRSVWAADDIAFWMQRLAFEIGFHLKFEETKGEGEIDRSTCSYQNISYFVNGIAVESAKAAEAALAGSNQWHELGSFQLESDTLRATDPCYDRDSWCATTFKVLPGVWRSLCLTGPTYWHYRVKELRIHHESVDAGVFSNLEAFKDLAPVGVDSAQCGFFDDALYVGRSEDGRDDSPFYRNCCDITGDKARPGAGVIEAGFGVVSCSGFGDGGYNLLVRENEEGQAIAAIIRFIGEEGENEDDSGEINADFEE